MVDNWGLKAVGEMLMCPAEEEHKVGEIKGKTKMQHLLLSVLPSKIYNF